MSLMNLLDKYGSALPLRLRRQISPLIDNSAEEFALWRLRQCGFQPGGIIDIGAYAGEWTVKARKVFPDVRILMVEAMPTQRVTLERIGKDYQAELHIAALWRSAGEKRTFYQMATGSSLLPERSNVPREEIAVITETLDDLNWGTHPLLIKIDAQGAEKLILEGAEQTLARTEALQLELPLVAYNEGAPSFLEMLIWLDDAGFVPFDTAGAHRPFGLQACQIDLIFVRRDAVWRQAKFSF
jgi:FkbM family methyltransferase